MSDSTGPRRSARRRRRWRLGLLVVLAAVAWWAVGFLRFAAGVPLAVERPQQKTDAIVVLTGGSGRLDEGLALLREGYARKLLVSGVFRGVDVDGLLQFARRGDERLSGQITLGHEADDTRGNARETARWMTAEGLDSLRLVTSAYHMPRSLFEFRRAMPAVELIAHPVFTAAVRLDVWWRSPGTASLLASEYIKLLLARARAATVDLWAAAAGGEPGAQAL